MPLQIAALCHDIGEQLGCGGAMESLTRSRVGIFGIEEALTLEQLETLRDEDKISNVIIKPDAVFEKDRAVTVTPAGQRMAENGNVLTMDQLERQGGDWGTFYTLWTLKEARVKCTGEGLRRPPRDIAVPLLRPGETGELDGLVFSAFSGETWRAAACCPTPQGPLELFVRHS